METINKAWRSLFIISKHYSTPVSFQERFPPNIYYKIYTHRPIQDLCANAPRNYTTSATKQKDMKCSHNKNFIIPKNGKKLNRTTVGITCEYYSLKLCSLNLCDSLQLLDVP